jgi:Cof subfamily protein (haloacid dehalogenase superfamily)
VEKIKLLCADVDGTLLNSQHTINLYDKELIQRAWNEKHIYFAIVSGRFRAGVTYLAKELEIPCIYSCFNGNYLEWQGNVINDVTIDLQKVKDLIPIVEQTGLVPVIFDRDSYYFSSHNEWYDKQVRVLHAEGHIGPWKDFYEDWEKNNHPVYKVLAKHQDAKKIIELEKKLKELHYPGIDVFRSNPSILEIVPAGTSKATTLFHLSKYFSIDMQEIMSFGDYMNDYEMIKECPHGVAMGNALQEVKDVAWYVTKTNDDCGLGYALNKFLFD